VDTDCALITPIGLDHQEFLGTDLESIAYEKAGIIRPGVPLVCTQSEPPVPVLQAAKRMKAPVYRRGTEFDFTYPDDLGTGRPEFSLAGQTMPVAEPSMAGAYQLDNLAAALCAFALLNPDCFSRADEISSAIRGTTLPGRLQSVAVSPEIILDVGHNILAAEAVAAFLEQEGRSDTCCVLAMLADKPAEAVAISLGKVCSRWWCAALPGPRGQTGEALASRVRSVLPHADIRAFAGLDAAMQDAVSSTARDGTILVFGSFLTVSAAAEWVRNGEQHNRHDAARIT